MCKYRELDKMLKLLLELEEIYMKLDDVEVPEELQDDFEYILERIYYAIEDIQELANKWDEIIKG